MKNLRVALILVVIAFLTNSVVFADDSTIVTLNSWIECNSTGTTSSSYYIEIKHDGYRVELDYFDVPTGYKRVWLNTPDIKLTKSKGFSASFSPGIIASNSGQFWAGGIFNVDVPKLRLNICQKSYVGNMADKHVTFTTMTLNKSLSVMHYYYMQTGYRPDSYIGLDARIGTADIWYGISTNKPGAKAFWFSVPIKF